jgi:excisionase family DNA binding protein
VPIEWLSLDEVAQRLGVSSRTARRWIREGKIHAELRPGPTGPEYHVPDSQMETAAAIQTAVEAEDGQVSAAPGESLESYLDEREGNVISMLEGLRDRLEAATSDQTSLEERLREEMRQIHDQLSAGIEALRQAKVHEVQSGATPAQPRRWWWPF